MPRPRLPLKRSFMHETGLLKLPEKRNCNRGRFTRLMIPYLKNYCSVSSVHGIRYLTDPKLRIFERFIWLVILIVTSIGASIVYVDLAELYNSARTHTTIEDTMQPIFYVPFPSVGICMRNRINFLKLENEAADEFLGANATMDRREIFTSFMAALSDINFSDMSGLSRIFSNATLAAEISQLDELDLTRVLRFVNLQCKDVFVGCTWRRRPYNCCEIFELQRTEMGFCWIFNTAVSAKTRKLASEDKYYPRRTAQSGPGTGLEVHLTRNRSLVVTSKKGVYVMIKQPHQWSDSARLVPPNSNNRISVVPRFTGADARTRDLPPRKRRCIFPDEVKDPNYKNLPGFVYWRGNCRTRCHQEYAVRLCQCSPSLLFPVSAEDNFTDCKASQFKCFYEHRLTFSVEKLEQETEYVDDVYKDSMTCDCLNSCSQLIYDTIHSSNALDSNEMDSGADTLHIDVFFQSPWYIKYQTHMRFTFVELLASFGGIIGLFLGASMLSAFELVYYFTIGLYLYLFKPRRQSTPPPAPPPQPIVLHLQRKVTPKKLYF